jgi:UDP-N-acetylglucosamine transferase subunit ALG13
VTEQAPQAELAPKIRRQMVVTVGTDHHPFDRLVRWAENWAERVEDWQVHVQYGRSRAPRSGLGFAFCDPRRLQELFETADVVITHGGPATITEARRFGHRPIVVPRDPRLGEHVDDHQQLFARRLAGAGVVDVVETEDDFLAAVVATSYLPRQRSAGESVPPGVARVGAAVERVAWRRRH